LNCTEFLLTLYTSKPLYNLNEMNNAVMRAAMTRLGFTDAAAQALVDEQGMDSLEEIRLLTNEEIESLCDDAREG
jgi:ribosomal protein S13